jgi:peptidoglycan LD-endopeptidase LytH
MTRTFWVVAALVALAVLGFASTLSFGPARLGPAPQAVPPASDDAPGSLVVPVRGYPRAAIRDSWGGGTRAHHGTDIMAAGGTPVVAAAPGTVEKLFTSRLGGITAYVRSPDRRWTFYYAHLAGYAPGLAEGQRLRAGDPIGFVGDTGDAGPGNTHLHFGVTRMRGDERWWQGEDVNPYPLLAGTGRQR